MKKYGSLIALAVVVVLAIVVVVTRQKPVESVKAPYSIKKVESLARVELTQPGDKGGLVVLARGEDGWALQKPVEAPLVERVATQLSEALAEKINTDDIKLDAGKLAEFGLGDDAATKVALFGEGAEQPAAEFWLGKTISVEGTRAKRTYIKTIDGKVYRAQTDLGEILGKPVDELRSKTIVKSDREAVKEIWVKYPDESQNLRLARDGENWKLAEPAVDFELDRSASSALLNGVTNLVATGFADGKTPAEVGLDPWHVKLIAGETGKSLTTILFSEAKDGKAYAMVEGGKHIFEVAESTAKQVTVTPLTLRTRLAKNLPIADVARIDFGGADRVAAVRGDDGWSFARGGKGKVKEATFTTMLNSLAQLRAVRYEGISAADAGLTKPAEKVTLTMKDGSRHTLLVGAKADDKGNIWAKWDDMDLVMVVPQWIMDRAAPKAAELVEEAS